MRILRVTHASERLSSKDQRRLAKRDLKRGRDPQPQYRTGRFWND